MKAKFRLPVFLKGIAMGAADVVPGVSGGTIAFITGIYEELINSIRSVNGKAVQILIKKGIPSFWKHINGWFLLSLLVGIAISIFSLARLITFLLSNYPILVWAFFFGLILASAIFIATQIKRWNVLCAVVLLAGAVAAYFITTITPANGNASVWYIVLSGAIAICAMILPGISGSFILLLLGMYSIVVGAVGELNLKILLPFIGGAIIGLLAFSNILGYLFKHFKDITLALLTGFMIGALNKVWPWKQVLSTYTDSHGEIQPLTEKSILPAQWTELNQAPSQLLMALLFFILGCFVVFGLEKLNSTDER